MTSKTSVSTSAANSRRQSISAQDLLRIEQTLKDQDLEFARLTEVLRDNPDGLFGVESSLFEELTADAKVTPAAVPATPNAVRC
jgi:hypothetical protein